MMRAILTTAALIAMTYAAQAQITCSTLAGITTCTMPPPQPIYQPSQPYGTPPPVIVAPQGHAFTQGLASGAYALESTERTRQMQAANPPPCPIGLRWLGMCE